MNAHPHDHDPNDLAALIRAAAHYLPAQGPIDVFIHHNTLHAFENEPFEDAVIHASSIFGTEPFLSESRYRDELAHGRIRTADIEAVLEFDSPHFAEAELAGGRLRLRDLHRVLLLHPVRQESDTSVRWTLTESDVLQRLRADLPTHVRHRLLDDDLEPGGRVARSNLGDSEDEATRRTTFARADMGSADRERRVCSDLWHACLEAMAISHKAFVHVRPPVRHRDLIRAVDPTMDTDELVHPLLIRLCAAYLDQGVASWPMPDREHGLLQAAAGLYAGAHGPTEPWSVHLPAALRACRGLTADEVIVTEIDRLGVPRADRGDFIRQTLLALRGWAGMIYQFQERPDRAPVEQVPARLVDFLALRLVLDRVAAEWAARRNGIPPSGHEGIDLASWRVELQDRFPPHRGPGTLARAFLLHQVSQLVGMTGHDIRSLDENELLRFERAISAFDATSRRRLFHLAYERRHRIMILDALAAHVAVASPRPATPPTGQIILCIDERCESFRRHVEELGRGYETFGTAGFFAVPMYYQGLDDWHPSPLCPIVMRPSHTVLEVPEDHSVANHRLHRNLRKRYGQLSGSLSVGSRTLFRGGLFSALAGGIAAIPLVARVAFPRLAARIGKSAADVTRRRIATRLDLFRDGPAPLDDGTSAGFDVDEMAGMVRRVLEDIGLTTRLSRLVAVLGHGSSSRNNPHESAYDCGACGGGKGGPNARAFAMMANDARVRERLVRDGLMIPDDTRFIGGMLDTCADGIAWFDVDRLPDSHHADMQAMREVCSVATAADAHERCRRFESAAFDLTPAEALAHVEARSVDLAQVRPELGHATNAVCIIGRRWRTQGLFLDRRAFLVSYDPTTDVDGTILARTLAAVGPVGAGINLEYFFSTIDRLGYGAGTKLPHNITGLIGVMDGHGSDLRTGLPWQMVEIHEPVRLLVVIDAQPTAILAAAEAVPAVKKLVVNRWIQLVSWDPDTGGLSVFEQEGFRPYVSEGTQPPVVDRSADWYGGHREHLPPARVLNGLEPHPSRQGGAA
ncbi:MAG: DUF2309 domain-containing protein [Planctomycetia bacterium]|nr:DUF2309 domain-containing protein [Planctomycetia bacterium]